MKWLNSEELTRLTLEDEGPGKGRRVPSVRIRSREDAVNEFERRTGLFVGRRPDEWLNPFDIPWRDCNEDLARVCQEDIGPRLLLLRPNIRSRDRRDRDRVRKAIERLKKEVWAFVMMVNPGPSLPTTPPMDMDGPALAKLLTADSALGNTQEGDRVLSRILDGEPAVVSSGREWRLSSAEIEALSVLLRMPGPCQDPPVPVPDSKVSVRREMVLLLWGQVERRDGRRLTPLDIALFLWGVVGADWGTQSCFAEYARLIRRDFRFIRESLESGIEPPGRTPLYMPKNER